MGQRRYYSLLAQALILAHTSVTTPRDSPFPTVLLAFQRKFVYFQFLHTNQNTNSALPYHSDQNLLPPPPPRGGTRRAREMCRKPKKTALLRGHFESSIPSPPEEGRGARYSE